jgi:hypothetical protein
MPSPNLTWALLTILLAAAVCIVILALTDNI